MDELRDHLNIIAAVGSGICVVQIFGLILALILYVKLKDVEKWHTYADPNLFFKIEDPYIDGVSIIYEQEQCPIHPKSVRMCRESQTIDSLHLMDVKL